MEIIKFKLSDHTCDACVINCMDFRIYRDNTLHKFILDEMVDSYDLISVPGAGKAIIDESSRPLVINSIKISMELHNSDIVYLIHHRDCGAYGGSDACESLESEFEMHKSELMKAEGILKAELGSSLNIRKVFFDSNDKKYPDLEAIYL